MHDLKERLEPVKLSDEQKKRIIRNVKEERVGTTRPRYQKGPVIASVILGIAVLFLVFNLLMEPETILQPGGSQAAEQEQSEAILTWKIVIWNTMAVILMVIALLATKRAVQHVKRWQSNVKVSRLKSFLVSKPKFISLLLMLAVAIWGGSFLLAWSPFYTHVWVAVYYILGFFMLEVYHTRDYEWASCPHCGTRFTRKQIRKKTMWQYREKCDSCEQPIFVNPKKKGSSPTWLYSTFLIYHSVFNMHFFLVMMMVGTSLWLLFKYISPYAVQFIAEQKDDPNLW